MNHRLVFGGINVWAQAAADIAAGSLINLGNSSNPKYALVTAPVTNGSQYSPVINCVVDATKSSAGQSFTVGSLAYVNTSNGLVQNNSTGGLQAGIVLADLNSTTVRILLL